MIRTGLRYHAPTSLDEACQLLADSTLRAQVIGGGTMSIPPMVRGEHAADHVIHLHRARLDGIRRVGDWIEVGSTATYSDVLASDLLAEFASLMPTLAAGITGGDQIRNLGTVGGSACYANPSSDVPAALVALGAHVRIQSVDGVRELPITDFYLDAFTTVLQPNEILTAILLPADAAASGYYKLKLSESSWPIATAAAVTRRPEGRWQVRLAMGGVRATPVHLDLSDMAADNGTIPEQWFPEIGELVRAQLERPWDDELAPGNYRREIAPSIATRALKRLQERLVMQ